MFFPILYSHQSITWLLLWHMSNKQLKQSFFGSNVTLFPLISSINSAIAYKNRIHTFMRNENINLFLVVQVIRLVSPMEFEENKWSLLFEFRHAEIVLKESKLSERIIDLLLKLTATGFLANHDSMRSKHSWFSTRPIWIIPLRFLISS